MAKKKDNKVAKQNVNDELVQPTKSNENNTNEEQISPLSVGYVNDIVVSKTIGLSELYYAKKCNEILLSHYNNLTTIVPTYDSDYSEITFKLNKFKKINEQIMNKIEEKILNIDLC